MVILFGGLVGTGKTELARAVAQNLNVSCYEIDKAKVKAINANAALQFNMRYSKPHSEEAKLMIYSRALQHLSELSKTHKDIVADEDFHKKHSRSIFFERIRESMGEGSSLSGSLQMRMRSGRGGSAPAAGASPERTLRHVSRDEKESQSLRRG